MITPAETERIEIADFGLGDFEHTGLGVLVYVNTQRVCAKELAMLPRQTCPEHRHPPVGDDPGLDGYAQRCHDGLLSACDDLYNLSPPMSDYERYGMTCGGRTDVLTVAACEELDGD